MKPRSNGAAARAGFSLIEVMMAIVLFAIGMVGVTQMQQAVIRSNQDAYETMVATDFARTWLERIKRDALGWNAPGPPPVAVMFAGRPDAAPNYFVESPDPLNPNREAPWPLDAFESHGANYHGVDVGLHDPLSNDPVSVVTNEDIYYCAFSWFTPVHRLGGAGGLVTAMRADVGVWWTSRAFEDIKASPNSIALARKGARGCATPGVIPDLTDRHHRVVYLTTVVHWTPR